MDKLVKLLNDYREIFWNPEDENQDWLPAVTVYGDGMAEFTDVNGWRLSFGDVNDLVSALEECVVTWESVGGLGELALSEVYGAVILNP